MTQIAGFSMTRLTHLLIGISATSLLLACSKTDQSTANDTVTGAELTSSDTLADATITPEDYGDGVVGKWACSGESASDGVVQKSDFDVTYVADGKISQTSKGNLRFERNKIVYESASSGRWAFEDGKLWEEQKIDSLNVLSLSGPIRDEFTTEQVSTMLVEGEDGETIEREYFIIKSMTADRVDMKSEDDTSKFQCNRRS